MAVARLQHVSDVRFQAAPRNGLAGALRLAGYALAHAAMSIERDGELCTLAAVAEDGELLRFYRYPNANPDTGMGIAREHLARQIGEGTQGALVHAGTIEAGKRRQSSVLVVDLLGPGGADLGRLMQPYRPQRFRLPKFGYLRGFAIRGGPIVDHLADETELRYPQGGAQDVESRIYWGVHDHPHGVRLFAGPMRLHSRRSQG
jgi:hypothetical protein